MFVSGRVRPIPTPRDLPRRRHRCPRLETVRDGDRVRQGRGRLAVGRRWRERVPLQRNPQAVLQGKESIGVRYTSPSYILLVLI